MNCILTASRLYAVWLLFCGISACPFSELRSFRCGHLFCISGFMIMFTTEKSTKYFFRKRLVRILPLYYLMTLGTYLSLLLFPSMFQQTRHDFSYLVKSLLFIPFDIGSGAIQPLVRIGWTINCEMLFYLLFSLSFHISMKYRGLICSAFLVILVGMVQIFAPAISSWQSPIGNVLSPFLIFTEILSCWNFSSEFWLTICCGICIAGIPFIRFRGQ